MAEEAGETHISSYSLGLERDVDLELAYSKQGTGLAYDMRNGRPISIEGTTGIAQKIQGEIILYPNSTGLVNYVCCISLAVNTHLVDVWMPSSGIGPGIIRIDGVIVLQSASFILDPNQVQGDKNEALISQEIYLTDNTIPPSIFSITDLINSVSSPKYFAAFDPLLYQVNLQTALDRPMFVELKNVGVGLPVGQYQYQMQYANDEGDVTNWSFASDIIPVVESLSQQSDVYPYAKTYGGQPDPTSPTGYAIHLRFRVTNIYNYTYINIKRIAYNQGAGINFTPNGVIVAKIQIAPGEISVRDYYDPNQSNTLITLSEQQESQIISEIDSAKSIRYFNRRLVLMNIKVKSKLTNPTFLTINSKPGFPVIHNMGKSGHKDPFNHAYYRSEMRGDVEGYGVVQFDGVGVPGFVNKYTGLENYQFPNRRDEISAETAQFSLYGTVKAPTTDITTIGQTHEVFDLDDPVTKTDYGSFKNIIRAGPFIGTDGSKTKSDVNTTILPTAETASGIESHGAYVDSHNLVTVSYQPYHPTSQSDQDTTGHKFIPTTGVYQDDTGSTPAENNPPGFAPNYYSMGMCVAGVDNFAPWAKAFAVVKTPSKKKVICQGLGYYSMKQADFDLVANLSLCNKDQNRMWFYSPDIQNGLVSSDLVNDIIANPQNYSLQFVSPLGFFSEVYNFETSNNDLRPNRDGIIDMMTYVRMIKDISGGIYSNGNPGLNPGETPNMGIPGGDGFNYVTWEKFRNQNFPSPPLPFRGGTDGGNQVFGISDCERLVEGRGEYLSLGTIGDFYDKSGTGGTGSNDFIDTGMQDWTEPMYIVNIIRSGTEIIDQNIEGYQQTSHYQKLKSIIGLSNGNLGQKFVLVDERWEDCIPAPQPTLQGASDDRFIYVKDPNTNIVTKWINVTYKTVLQKAAIISAMPGNGISGLYTHENVNNQNRFYNIVFDQTGFVPPVGNYIYVYYDNTAPIRVYGGDTYIHEAIFSPIDRVANSVNAQADTQFQFGIGFPYHRVQQNARFYQIKKTTALVGNIQGAINCRLGFIRQMAAMFTCETRCCSHYAFNKSYPDQFFPLIGYVIRADQWEVDKNEHDNSLWPQYAVDYPNELSNWEYGGFRFLPQINADYSHTPPIKFFSMPEFGYIERTKYETGIMHSLPRVMGVQDSPSLKTFPANNLFIIDDNQGEIKYAWDATTDKGENLYSICNKGVCLLITNKNILTDQNSGQLGFMSGQFIGQQLWITKEIGCYDQFWRGIAEGHVPLAPSGDGSEVTVQALFIPSVESTYRFMNNELVDVGRIGYYSKVYQEGIANVKPGFTSKMTGVYNRKHKEFWLYIKDVGTSTDNLFVFGQKTNRWYGTFDYKFEKFTTIYNKIYGHRGVEAWELDSGFIINGTAIQFEAVTAIAPEQSFDKEYMRITINTVDAVKPTRVEFYQDASLTVQCALDNSIQGTFYLKNYRGFSNQIPRKDAAVDVKRDRLQGRSLLYKVIHNLASDFKLIDSSVLYKIIKGQK